MHLTAASDAHSYNIDEYEQESFRPIAEESAISGRKISTLFKASEDIESDIAEVANKGAFDLLLIGVGKSIYHGTVLGKILGFSTRILQPERLFSPKQINLVADSALDDRTSSILSKTHVTTGVFIDRNFVKADRVVVLLSGDDDFFPLDYAKQLIANNDTQVIIIYQHDVKLKSAFKENIRLIKQNAPNNLSDLSVPFITTEHFGGIDLMITSYRTWTSLVNKRTKALADAPSTLVIRNR